MHTAIVLPPGIVLHIVSTFGLFFTGRTTKSTFSRQISNIHTWTNENSKIRLFVLSLIQPTTLVSNPSNFRLKTVSDRLCFSRILGKEIPPKLNSGLLICPFVSNNAMYLVEKSFSFHFISISVQFLALFVGRLLVQT